MADRYGAAEGISVVLDGDGVLRIVFDAPTRRNALRDDAVAVLIDSLVTANSDEQVRVVLLSGANGDFCSGADIVARNADPTARPRVGSISRRLPAQAHRLIPLLMGIQVPVVAAVQGYAVGLGMQLVLAADFAVVSTGATLFEPFAARGMAPDSGATWLLPRVVGSVRARELLLLGRRLDGAEAAEWGIAHRAVPGDEVSATADELAGTLAAGPTVALGLARSLINDSWDRPLSQHLAGEASAMEITSRSKDFKEGISAFREKRQPQFSGR
jgi:2-(1,2-epoxy-1,2-dihydrophenyl)acetyl-CoA isomerase